MFTLSGSGFVNMTVVEKFISFPSRHEIENFPFSKPLHELMRVDLHIFSSDKSLQTRSNLRIARRLRRRRETRRNDRREESEDETRENHPM